MMSATWSTSSGVLNMANDMRMPPLLLTTVAVHAVAYLPYGPVVAMPFVCTVTRQSVLEQALWGALSALCKTCSRQSLIRDLRVVCGTLLPGVLPRRSPGGRSCNQGLFT